MTIPAVRIMAGDDLKDLSRATVVLCPRRGTNGHYGFLVHDDAEALQHSCRVISRRLGHAVREDTVRDAFWRCARHGNDVFSISVWCVQACALTVDATLDALTRVV